MRIDSINGVLPQQSHGTGIKGQALTFKAEPALAKRTAAAAGTGILASIVSFFKEIKELFKSDDKTPDEDFHPSYQSDLDMIEYNSRVYG